MHGDDLKGDKMPMDDKINPIGITAWDFYQDMLAKTIVKQFKLSWDYQADEIAGAIPRITEGEYLKIRRGFRWLMSRSGWSKIPDDDIRKSVDRMNIKIGDD